MEYRRETLVAKLREHGVECLAPSDAVAEETVPSSEALLMALVAQSVSRLQLALIPLFIRQPDLAHSVPFLVNQLDSALSLELQTLLIIPDFVVTNICYQKGFYVMCEAQKRSIEGGKRWHLCLDNQKQSVLVFPMKHMRAQKPSPKATRPSKRKVNN